MQHKGWYKIAGVQDGDRTLDQQLLGLGLALERCGGQRILDLGCAEGLIARAFCQAGAQSVRGVEIIRANAEEARRQCAGYPVKIHCQNVEEFVDIRWKAAQAGYDSFDCVLALAILHKLKNPSRAAAFIGMVARQSAVIRLPPHTPRHLVRRRPPRGCVQEGP